MRSGCDDSTRFAIDAWLPYDSTPAVAKTGTSVYVPGQSTPLGSKRKAEIKIKRLKLLIIAACKSDAKFRSCLSHRAIITPTNNSHARLGSM